MGIKIPNGSGGFKDTAGLKRYDGTNWVECQFARMYENGAWVDKWTNAKPFYIIQNFALVSPAKMGGWVHNNFYAYTSQVTKNGGNLNITALTTNNATVRMATASSNSAVNVGADGISPTPFALEKCNKCRIVIDFMGGTNVGSVIINVGGVNVPHNYVTGTYIIDLGAATTSYIWVQIGAYAYNTNYCNIKELYFYRG